MTWNTLIALMAIVAAAFFIIQKRTSSRTGERSTKDEISTALAMKKPLSEPEQVLYFRLRAALPECEVLAQVAFSRFLEISGGDKAQRFGTLQTINKKSADYLVCLKDFTIVAVVELDDSTHTRTRDDARDAMLDSAGIKTLRWNVRAMPSEAEIRQVFDKNR